MKKSSIAIFIALALACGAAFADSATVDASKFKFDAAANSEVENADAVAGTCSGKHKISLVLSRQTSDKGSAVSAEFKIDTTNLLNVTKKHKINLLAGEKKMLNVQMDVALIAADCAKPSMSNCVKHYRGVPALTPEQVNDIFNSETLKIDYDFNGCEFSPAPLKQCYAAFKELKAPAKKAVCSYVAPVVIAPPPPPATWKDGTGLVWKTEPSKEMPLSDAQSYCEKLADEGGGWRLPTIDELRSLVKGCDATALAGTCKASDKCLKNSCADKTCKGCEAKKGSAKGCYLSEDYGASCDAPVWSGSTVKDDKKKSVWSLNFSDGSVFAKEPSALQKAVCVKKENK